MANLTHLFKENQKVMVSVDGEMFAGIVKETFEDHIIVNVPEISDHMWYENGLNMDHVFPEYNFLKGGRA